MQGKIKIVLEVEYDASGDAPPEVVFEEFSEPYEENGQIRMDCRNVSIIQCSIAEIEEL